MGEEKLNLDKVLNILKKQKTALSKKILNQILTAASRIKRRLQGNPGQQGYFFHRMPGLW